MNSNSRVFLTLTGVAFAYHVGLDLLYLLLALPRLAPSSIAFYLLKPAIYCYLFFRSLKGEDSPALLAVISIGAWVRFLWQGMDDTSYDIHYFLSLSSLAILLSIWTIQQFRENNVEVKRYGLARLQMVPLLTPIDTAVELYGNPIEVKTAEKNPEAKTYVFTVGDNHEVVVTEWKGQIHVAVYWSKIGVPALDLRCMLDRYSEGIKWKLVEKGYLYQRADGLRRLWCSAIPAIGVGTVEYLRSEKATRD